MVPAPFPWPGCMGVRSGPGKSKQLSATAVLSSPAHPQLILNELFQGQ